MGKALGGVTGGFICASHVVVDLLRQKHRQYLFSNTLGCMNVTIAMEALKLLEEDPYYLQKL